MKVTVLPLVGSDSLRAMNAFNMLLLGLCMLPVNAGTDYVTFLDSFKDKTDDEKESALRQACAFVSLDHEEISALVGFSADANGVPYGKANIKNLGPDSLMDIIVAVCMEIGRIEINLLSEGEKKKSITSQST